MSTEYTPSYLLCAITACGRIAVDGGYCSHHGPSAAMSTELDALREQVRELESALSQAVDALAQVGNDLSSAVKARDAARHDAGEAQDMLGDERARVKR